MHENFNKKSFIEYRVASIISRAFNFHFFARVPFITEDNDKDKEEFSSARLNKNLQKNLSSE